MVNLNRTLGLNLYGKICNPRRFVYSPYAEKIIFKDMIGGHFVVDKQNDSYYINGVKVDFEETEDIIEKLGKIIVERDPAFTIYT